MSDPQNETTNETPAETPKKSTRASSSKASSQAAQSAAGTSQTAQASAAVTNAVGVVRERLMGGEQLVLAAAGVIVVVYLLFDFLLDYPVFVGGFVPVLAALTVLAIWVHRWGHYDFGNGYRLVIGALGISLALFAVTSLLAWARVGGDSQDFLHLIARIIYWVSGIAAGFGAWQVFRVRDA